MNSQKRYPGPGPLQRRVRGKRGHGVKLYSVRSYSAGDTYPREECRRLVLSKTSMYSTTAARAAARVAKSASWTSSFFNEAKKLSIGALSPQSARRLMLRVLAVA